jgi:PST family polysaccharide transporter
MTDDSPPADELRAAAVHGVRSSSIARPATELLLLGSMIVLARLIVPAEFGRYAVALIAQELAYVVVSEAVGSPLVQRAELRREHLQAGVALALIIGVALSALMLGAASLVVLPIFGARTELFIQLLTPLCLISALGIVPTAMLRRRMAFRRLSEMEVANTLMRVLVCIGLAVAGLSGEALIFGTVAGGLAMTLIAVLSARQPLPRLHPGPARELLHYGLPASLASVSWVGFRNSDYAIVGARLGALPAGLYYRAYTLAVDYQKKVSVVMNQVGFPLLSRTGGNVAMAEMRRQMVRLLTIVLFPLLALLTILAPIAVPFFFGSHWSAAVAPTQVLAVGGAATLVIDAAGTVLMAAGRTRALLGYGLAHWIVYGLSVFLVVPLGITAVAIDASVVHTVFLLVAYRLMLHGSEGHYVRQLWDDIAPATVSCVGLVAVALPANLALNAAHLPALVQLAATGAVAVPPYLLALRLCFPSTFRSLRSIVGQVVPDHRRLGWAKRRLVTAEMRSTA